MKRRDFLKHTVYGLTSAGLLAACGGGAGSTTQKKMKVVLIGVDGVNWQTLDPLMEQGKLPFWKQLKEESAWASLKTFRPTKSSVVWTSIATGTRMEKHGILDFTFLDRNNIQVPYSNAERREPAIWQILDEYNKKNIVLNWFVSHPPDKINGIMVSDNFRRVVARAEDKIGQYKDSVHPSIYFNKLLKLANRDYTDVFRKTGLPDYPKLYSEVHPDENFKKVPILQTYRSLAKQDYFVSEISKNLFRTKDFDLFATYIRMPDLVQHFSTRMFDPGYNTKLYHALRDNTITPEQRQEAILKIADTIMPAYRFAEDLIQTLLTYKKYEDATFIICSDHGFSLYPGGYNHYNLPEGYPPPPGVLLVKGPNVRKGELDSASVLDIAPTILYLFDLPIGKNMDGKPLRKAFDLNRKLAYKPYKIKKLQKRKKSKADEEALKELKSIGYIK